MNLNSYNLSYSTMVNLMKMIDLGQVNIVNQPKRNCLSEIHRFIRDYLDYKSK